jgi:hypothetical protein
MCILVDLKHKKQLLIWSTRLSFMGTKIAIKGGTYDKISAHGRNGFFPPNN